MMVSLAKACTAVAAVAFVLAVGTHLMETIFLTTPEGFSRTSNNLSLLAIALILCFRNERTAPLP